MSTLVTTIGNVTHWSTGSRTACGIPVHGVWWVTEKDRVTCQECKAWIVEQALKGKGRTCRFCGKAYVPSTTPGLYVRSCNCVYTSVRSRRRP